MTTTVTFDTEGEHTYTIPDQTLSVWAEVYGAGGGPSNTDPGAPGGYAEGELPVSSGETITIFVGGSGDDGGFNGGGDGPGEAGNGGGASDIRVGGDTLSDRVIVGAGGGGAGGDGANGGAGGGLVGEDGEGGRDDQEGEGGTQTEGGIGQAGGDDGGFGYGGDGQSSGYTDQGGGGGSGWYGGGGGGYSFGGSAGGGGGGGSSYIDGVESGSTTTGAGAAAQTTGEVVLHVEQYDGTPDDPESLSATSDGSDTIHLTWTDDGDYAESYNIYRSTSSGSSTSDYTLIDNTSSIGYTDTGLTNGRQYHYRVTAVDENESGPTNEDSATTALPSPNLDTVTGGDRQVVIDWILNDNNPDGTVEIDRDGTTVDTVSDVSQSSYTDTGADLDGREYEYRIRRNTPDVTEESSTDVALTTLPPVENFTVESINGRFVTLSWADPSNNTDHYELLIRKAGDSVWDTDAIISGVNEGSSVTHETSELLDGQSYESTVKTVSADTEVRYDE